MRQEESINVLLIEDDAADVFLIREMLAGTEDGISLKQTARLSEGLAVISGGDVDIVLLDMNLPDSTGIKTLTKVVETAPDVPVIVLTGNSDEVFGMEVVRNSAQDFLIKGGTDKKTLKRAISYAIERKRSETALKESENRLRTITSVLGEGLIVVDREGRLMLMNPEAEKLLGLREKDLWGQEILELICPGVMAETKASCPLSEILVSGLCMRMHEDVFLKSDGTQLPVAHISTPMIERGEVVGAVIAFHDISERKQHMEMLRQANELLAHQATTDTLTGIHNRLCFNEMLIAETNRARRYSLPLSLIMFDLDHFKKINDTFGHGVGDHVLRETARLVSGHIREMDIFARWGGEEFMVLVPNNDLIQAAFVAEKLRGVIEAHDFGDNLKVTSSFGVAEFRAGDSDDVFAVRADEAMYRAKSNGRNRVESL